MPSANSSPSVLNALFSSPHLSFMDEVTRLCRELGDFSIPEGYEDDTGFHYVPVHSVSHSVREGLNSQGEHI